MIFGEVLLFLLGRSDLSLVFRFQRGFLAFDVRQEFSLLAELCHLDLDLRLLGVELCGSCA